MFGYLKILIEVRNWLPYGRSIWYIIQRYQNIISVYFVCRLTVEVGRQNNVIRKCATIAFQLENLEIWLYDIFLSLVGIANGCQNKGFVCSKGPYSCSNVSGGWER